jgi:dCMP deaminase
MNRPNWTNYFLGLAKVVSQRSHDIHTKHGCVITDRNNRVLGMGYNGFPRSLDDKNLPTNRPEKYSWMVHAERNALSNCIVRPDNAIAYVTGQCCNDCIMALWQEGVSKVVMMNSHGTHKFDENAKKIFDTFVNMSKINIVYVDADLSWLRQVGGVI